MSKARQSTKNKQELHQLDETQNIRSSELSQAVESQMPGETSEMQESARDETNQREVNPDGKEKGNKGQDVEGESQTVAQPQMLHYGLYNQGATCYLNSVLQVLFMTTEIYERLNKEASPDHQLRKIFKKLKKKTYKTDALTEVLGIEKVHECHDAAECLEMILDKINPQASEVFKGQMKQKTKCSKCHVINEETETFWTLPLSLRDTSDSTCSVKNSFESYFQTKTHKMSCDECNKETEATSKSEMVESPQILTLHLKRSDSDSSNTSQDKSKRSVDVPCELQLQNKKYELYAMVNRHDSLPGGRYTATILSNKDNSWYEFEDELVTKVEKQPFAKSSTCNSRTVHLLMYRAVEPQMPSGTSEPDDSAQEENKHAEMESCSDNKRKNGQDDEEVAKTVAQPQMLHYGLINQGATCYLNSVLQVLFMTTEIHKRLDKKAAPDRQLTKIFKSLMQQTCRTKTLRETFGIENVYERCDAAECLEMILKKINPQASEVFKGQMKQKTKCSKCHVINEETETFWTLPLSLRNTSDSTCSVKNSFESYFQTKTHKMSCDECNKETEATSESEMVEFPQILTLHLKRSDSDSSNTSQDKSKRIVDVPCELQLQNKKYKLYGMVNRLGSLPGGQYTATILSNKDNSWYEFEDELVTKVEEQPFAKSTTYNSWTVRLLIYRAVESQMPCATSEPHNLAQKEKNQGEMNTHSGDKRKNGQDDKDMAKTVVESQMPAVTNKLHDSAQEKMDQNFDTCKEDMRKIGQDVERVTKPAAQPQMLHYGLYNQGATCYLNSVLQVLFMTTEIHDRLDSQATTDLQLITIFEDLKRKICKTTAITGALGIKNVHEHRDAADFLEMILREISQQASEVFRVQLASTIKCSRDHVMTEGTTFLYTLPLSVNDTPGSTCSVKNSFESNFQRKAYKGDNKMTCGECNRETEATEICEMVESPQILTLHLKRSDSDSSNTSQDKSKRSVDVPCELQFQNKKYKLYGMVNRHGSLQGGQYTATILSNKDNSWYEFEDELVTKVEEQPFEKSGTYSSWTVHLLMYRAVEIRELQDFTPDEPKIEAKTVVYYGLMNQGATCYLNSVLQVLFMTTEMHHRLQQQAPHDRQLREIFESLKEKICRTKAITNTFGIENVYEQRDAAECLEMILNKISRSASEVFEGQLTYTTKCSKGHIINKETNPFWNLPLSLRDSRGSTYSVRSSFERNFETKTYTGDNMVHCVDCDKKTEATSETEMVKSPRILTLLLKRFDFDFSTMSHFKSDCCVEVPIVLEVKNKKYKLYGIVNHMGSLRGGHYTATILSDEDNSWYEFNDEWVTKIDEQVFAEHMTYNSRTAYLLMYRGTECEMPSETKQIENEVIMQYGHGSVHQKTNNKTSCCFL